MRCAIGLVAAIVGVSACASSTPGDGDDVPVDGSVPPPDADPGDPPDARPPIDAPIDAPPQPVAVTLSQSASTTITALNSAACSNDTTGATRENSYYRVFPLAQHGVTGQLTANRIDFGIETASALAGSQTVQVRLHLLDGAFQTANLTTVYGQNVTVVDQDLTIVQATVSPAVVIPAGATLVAEIFVPDGDAAGNIFFIGSNAGGETAPSYVRAPACNINQPQTFASVAFPDTHIVLTVSGTTP